MVLSFLSINMSASIYQVVWCAEAPNFPTYYAAKSPVARGKLAEKGTELGTYNFWDAHHFGTKDECVEWIATNSPPAWTPIEHEIILGID
jgi:hypothetical protein